ncbi:MAG: hypothetical protein HY851_06105 [candidate division Zixibacteria bacterium]|nr:hypothetical protein [candidate division Zixibacteria bacterium]
MTLEESIDGLDKLESNGVTAWIDPKVNQYVGQLGDINIDFIDDGTRRGYVLTAGKSGEGKDCGGCSCG